MYSTRFTWLVIGACGGLLLLTGAALAEGDAKGGIAPQPLTNALAEFAERSGLQLVYLTELTEGIETEGAEPTQIPEEALDQLLADTGLRYEFINDRTVSIEPKQTSSNANPEPRSLGNSPAASASVLIAKNQTTAPQNRTRGTNESSTKNNSGEKDPALIEEIIVTGTNLRGIANSASPIISYDRQDIAETGFGTTEQLLQSLPQNFGSGSTIQNSASGTNRGDSGNLPNFGFGSGVNLRGLGNDATLVLVNGRRLAPGGSGNFVDISLLPISAIERVDVLVDGASAIYGSDAVAGVVNFILRDDFDGLEARVRYGDVTSGDSEEIKAGFAFGETWKAGNFLVSYDYYDRGRLDANDRDFSANAPEPSLLLPDQTRHGLFLGGNQEISEEIDLFGSIFFSTQDTDSASSFGGLLNRFSAASDQYGITLGMNAEVSQQWTLEVGGIFSTTEIERFTFNYETDALEIENQSESQSWSVDVTLDGPIFSLSGGDVLLAIGGQYRRERFDRSLITVFGGGVTTNFNIDRDISALFSEINIPVVGESNAVQGVRLLEFSAAIRWEDYSDFGSTANPKFGVAYNPIESIKVRGTYGTSFRAPLLFEKDNSLAQAGFLNVPDPISTAPDGTSPTFFAVLGSIPDLGPEEATTWTAGFDITPKGIPGLSISGTYYDIDYDDRIDRQLSIGTALTDPTFAAIVSRNPDPALLAELRDSVSLYFDFTGGLPLSEAVAFVDGRLRNFSSTDVRGVDFSIDYSKDTDIGEIGVGLSGNHIFEFINQITPSTEPFDIADSAFNPVDLRGRANASWSNSGLSVNAFINYVDSYEDEQVEPSASIESWTTVDLNVSYDTSARSDGSLLDNVVIALSIQNLFDKAPPAIVDFATEPARDWYDSVNANPTGRFVALEIAKQF